MRSKYLTDEDIPDFDKKIDEVLDDYDEFDGGGHTMVIAIRNRSGQVYRVIETEGMGEYIGVVHDILDLGFDDELREKGTSREGYDSLMRPANVAAVRPPTVSSDWSDDELHAAVDAYLWMLSQETRGHPYSKADVNRRLRDGVLASRTKASIEFRMQNVSATLEELCLPRIAGYVPAKHVGNGVKDRIRSALEKAGAFQLDDYEPTEAGLDFDAKVERLRKGMKLGTPRGIERPERVDIVSREFVRDPLVKAWVLENAMGTCEACGQPGPFKLENGPEFLEVHHVIQLAENGSDKISNAVALCPNCHRRFHLAPDRTVLTKGLYSRIDRLKR